MGDGHRVGSRARRFPSQQAIILDPGDARGFAVAGQVRAFLRKDAEAALWLHERAIDLNPNLAIAWCYSGLAHSYLGQHSEAICRIQHAQRLSPFDPHGVSSSTRPRESRSFSPVRTKPPPAWADGPATSIQDFHPPTEPCWPRSVTLAHARRLLRSARRLWRWSPACQSAFSRAVTLPEAGRSPSVRRGVAPSRDTRAIQTLRSIDRDRRGYRGTTVLRLKWTFALAALPGGDCVGSERTIKGSRLASPLLSDTRSSPRRSCRPCRARCRSR